LINYKNLASEIRFVFIQSLNTYIKSIFCTNKKFLKSLNELGAFGSGFIVLG